MAVPCAIQVLSPPVLSTPPRPSLNTSNSTEVLEAAPSGFTPTEPPSSTFNKTEGLEAAPSRPTQELLPSASLASMTLEAEQLPIKHASWWWSIPVVNIFRTAFLVELMWRLMAGLASFYIMHKVITTVPLIVFPNRYNLNSVAHSCHSLELTDLTWTTRHDASCVHMLELRCCCV